MSPLELRIKYKLDTGYSPTFGKDGEYIYNYRGNLKDEYAQWLEEFMVNSHTKNAILDVLAPYRCQDHRRQKYKFDTGNNSIWYDSRQTIRYYKAYKEWLEDEICHLINKYNTNAFN